MAGSRWLEVGGWRQVAGGRWLEAGGWRQVAGGRDGGRWLEAGGWRQVELAGKGRRHVLLFLKAGASDSMALLPAAASKFFWPPESLATGAAAAS